MFNTTRKQRQEQFPAKALAPLTKNEKPPKYRVRDEKYEIPTIGADVKKMEAKIG